MGRSPRVTRDAVLEAAREAFATRGYEGATLADIGRRVGVSAAALLRHEPTKEALFRAAMASGRGEAVSLLELFAQIDPRAPAASLRRLAERWVPFMEKKIGESFVEWLRANTGGNPSLRLPFDPRSAESPPRRFLTLLERFLIRAREAGTFRGDDARGAALAFLGALHAYVFLHRVVGVQPAMPLPRYIDTVISIWTQGALAKGRKR
ncbi:MAG: TetR/AcrR family transcriptional regulator [Thermoanaerobaculia bacterium]